MSNPLSLAVRLIIAVSAVLAGGAALVLGYSWFFHETTVEVHAAASPELVAALENDGHVWVQVYDAPVGGRLVAQIVTESASIDDGVLRVDAIARTRRLPQSGFVQVCVDGASDGHEVCGDANMTARQKVGDTVSCSRAQFRADRYWFSSSTPAFVDVSCDVVGPPLALAYADDTSVTIDGDRLALLEGRVTDLTAAINEHLITDHAPVDAAAEVRIENGTLFVEGEAHEEQQRLVLDLDKLTITKGNTVDLGSLAGTDDQLISAELFGAELQLTLEDGGAATVDLSTLTSDTDDQVLAIDEDVLLLSNGDDADSTVDLTPYLDNTDTLAALSCAALEYAVFDGAGWVCVDVTAFETLTTVGYDIATQTINYVNEAGATSAIPITTLETTTFVNDTLAVGHLIGTYQNEDGSNVDLLETVTSLVDNGDGTFTYTAEDGSASTLNASALETLTTFTNTVMGNPIGTYTDEDGVSFDVNETVTALFDNGDQTFSFANEAGNITTLDVADLETLTLLTGTLASGNAIGTYTDEDGVSFTLNESITSLATSGASTFTFTHEDGGTTTLDVADLEALTTVTNIVAGNRIATYTDEDGVSFDVNETITTLVDNGDGTFTFTDEAGTPSIISAASLETLTTVTNVVAGNRIATYTDEDGVSFDVNETVTSLVDNGDGTFTFTDEAGNQSVISAASLETLTTVTNIVAGNRIATYTDEDGVSFDVNETITTLVDNGDERLRLLTRLATRASFRLRRWRR